MTHNIERLKGEHSFLLPPDEGGYVGRECPDCGRYFKIVPPEKIGGWHCAYCGHRASHASFHSKAQTSYATSLMTQMAEEAIFEHIRDEIGDLAPTRLPKPRIRHYSEKQLEEHITCTACTLKYAVYGVFAFCPDCGVHNSQQILDKNLDLIGQMLNLAATQPEAIADRLVIDALQDAVAAFDGFGRESIRVRAAAATNPAQAQSLSFQNLQRAQQRLQVLFTFDLAGALAQQDWDLAHRAFQKRHVFAHAMGVVDQDYLNKTGDPSVALGLKLTVTAQEVGQLVGWLRNLGVFLVSNLPQRPS